MAKENNALENPLLSDIFERNLGLDKKSENSNSADSLWERISTRMDEVSANTQKILAAIVARPSGDGSGVTLEARGQSRGIIRSKSRSSGEAREERGIATRADDRIDGATRPARRKERKNQPTSIRANSRGDARALSSRASERSQTLSQRAQSKAKSEHRPEIEEMGETIGGSIATGLKKLGGLLKSSLGKVSANNNVKDAIGYAIGGPFYAAFNELKDALPAFERDKKRGSDTNDALESGKQGDRRQRDSKGRFVGGDRKAERQRGEQTEILENEYDLAIREAKKDEKRHKELVRAVRANKRGMLDRFLDRRIMGGRPRVTVRNDGIDRRGRRRRGVRGDDFDPRLDRRDRRDERLRNRRRRDDPDLDLERGERRGRRNRGDRGGRGAGRGLLGKFGDLAMNAGSKIGGVFATAGKGLLGALKILPGIGTALAAGMAVFDGFNGWNDKALHKRAFNLKDGQEATTGQKASAAAASILDMGGLTSGLLELFGIEFDKAGVAQSIYQLGSSIGQVAGQFLTKAGELLGPIWKGFEEFGGKVWRGVADIAESIGSMVSGLWNKGSEFVSNIASGAKEIGANIASFASDIIKKGGEILSGLWKDITEIPGKIVDGAADLAKGVYEGGKKLASDAIDVAKNAANSVADFAESAYDGVANFLGFGDDDKKKEQKVNAAFAEKSAEPAPILKKKEEKAPEESVAFAPEAKSIETSTSSTPVANSSETVAAPILSRQQGEERTLPEETAIDLADKEIVANQTLWTALHEKAERTRGELRDILESSDKNIKNIYGLLDREYNKNFVPDDGTANALNNMSNAIAGIGSRSAGGYGDAYSSSYGGASGGASNPAYSGLGDIVNLGETSGAGTAKVSRGDGDHGGVSYGRSQLASRVGSVKTALEWAQKNGYEDIYNELYPLLGDATNYNGQFAQKWRALAAQKGGRLEQFDRAYQKQGYYDPLMGRVRAEIPELAKRIDANPALQEQLLSTSVHYGINSNRYLSAAREVLAKNPSASDRDLLAGIQDIKARDVAKNFPSSSLNVQQGIAKRHGVEEKARLLALQDKFERGEVKINPATGTGQAIASASVVNSGPLRYNAASQGVRLNSDGKTVDLSTVRGVESLKLQSGVNIDKMHPEVVANMAAMAEAYEQKTGQKLEISEGYRDYAEQVRVKKKYRADAAEPGRSTHGTGITFDIAKSKIEDVENRLQAVGVDPVQFFRQYGFERSAYRPGKPRKHDESWHLESVKHRTANMQADRNALRSGRKTGAEYMTAEERARYMTPQVESAPVAVAESASDPVSSPAPVSESATSVPRTVAATSVHSSSAPAPIDPTASINARQPAPTPELIRDIDPAREIKTSANNDGAILAVLKQILAAIENGNKRSNSKNGGKNAPEGPPINFDFDDPFIQAMASDNA